MKKSMKKIFCSLLVVVMCLMCVPVSGLVGLNFYCPGFNFVSNATNYETYVEDCIRYKIGDEEAYVYSCEETASGDIIIPSTINGYPVTRIGQFAFADCKKITSVTISSGISEIGYFAFQSCTALKSVSLPESIVSVLEFSFQGCTNLEYIDVSDNNSIYLSDNGVLYNKKEKKLLRCPQTKSGNYIVLDETEEIDCDAFERCINLTSIVLPSSLMHIGSGAFMNCKSLKNVNIPQGVENISSETFKNCNLLEKIAIPNSVTTISYNAFENCSSLTEISIPNSVTDMWDRVFEGCYSLETVTLSDNVTCIPEGTFNNCTNLKNIKIPNGVETIEEGAFANCSSLSKITIPNSITSIGASAFEGCHSLESIVIPNNVTSISEATFACCYNLKNVVFNEGLKSIGSAAFGLCKSLTNIVIPSSVTSIDYGAFSYCYNLEDVTFNEGLKFIGQEAFTFCVSLKNISIPDSVTQIDSNAFAYCCKLKNVKLPKKITVCSPQLFLFCLNLETIQLPEKLENIEDYAFAGCLSLKDFEIPSSVISIGQGAFFNSCGINELTFSKEIKNVGESAFCLANDTLNKVEIHSNDVQLAERSIGYYNASLSEYLKNNSKESFIDLCIEAFMFVTPDKDELTEEERVRFDELCEIISPITDVETPIAREDFTVYGYASSTAETYANENNFKFINFDNNNCEHDFEHITVPSTCKVQGVEYDYCYNCEETFNYKVLPLSTEHKYGEWKTITTASCIKLGEEKRVCSVCEKEDTREIPLANHEYKHEIVVSTCKEQGYEQDVCKNCSNTINYKVLSLSTAHKYGEWKIITEATVFECGEKASVCSVCGHTKTSTVERLPSIEAKDDISGVSVIYTNNSYDSDIEVEVSQVFDGESYQVINSEKGNRLNCLYDITTTIEGQKVQPNASVWVKIQLPENFNPEKSYVYYVTNTGTLERMNSFVKDGYIYFETTHFSFYAIVDESSNISSSVPLPSCSCSCHKTGIAHFFFVIINFFQKLFGQNKVCDCGAKH